jgi:chemotaxis protein CheX
MIIDATREVFSTMVGLDPVPGPPRKERIRSFRESVSGMIGFSGDFRGMVAIHCPSVTAVFITGQMLGIEPEDSDIRDAMGEIANMVAGGLKVAFTSEGRHVDVSVPTTVSGAAYDLNCLAQAECVIIPFSVDGGEILVEFKHLAGN